MSDLKAYVNSLFKDYIGSGEIEDLKAEILSNLEAKKEDLIVNGMDEKEATELAKRSITTIDNLIDGNKQVYINKVISSGLQDVLLYTVIAWLTTIPIILLKGLFVLNWVLFLVILILGCCYYITISNKDEKYVLERKYINIKKYLKMRKLVWIIWGVFIVVYFIYITGLYFASNLWFSRPVRIEGPYSLAMMLIRYYIPFISIIIPLIVNKLPKIILKYEVGETYEQ